ncbi:MAG TPA: hypothetical protein PKI03_25280, partial [Pseudomonadota bacterium]|nr:hypothetical protein [Pseudomonadota bacterium]
GPYSVAPDGAGNLYVADTSNATIRKVVLRTGLVTTVAGMAQMSGSIDGVGETARFTWPYGVAIDSVGNLFVTDGKEHTLRKIQLPNAVVTTIAGGARQGGVKLGMLPGRLNVPFGVAALPTGEIFLAVQGENAILAIR